jgi:phosphatidate cytidylyltransferase
MTFGALLVGLLALGVWWDSSRWRQGAPPIAAPLLVALFTIPAAAELITILALAGLPSPRKTLLLSSALILLGKAHGEFHAFVHRTEWFVALLLLVTTLVSTVLILDRDLKTGAHRAAASFFVLALVTLQSTMIDVAYDQGTPVLFALVLTSKAGDTGAYLVGKSMGRHKLIEHISPKKTIEGAVGGFLASILVGVWLLRVYGEGRWNVGECIGVAAVVNLAGQVGGFLNSLCKRAAGVKDSGHILPEFGGAFDIVDSLFLAMPAGWALLAASAG